MWTGGLHCLNPNVQWSKTVDCRKCHQTWIYVGTSAFTFTLHQHKIDHIAGTIGADEFNMDLKTF